MNLILYFDLQTDETPLKMEICFNNKYKIIKLRDHPDLIASLFIIRDNLCFHKIKRSLLIK